MKIGIVTIMDYTNYGNRLQNYAVSYVLRKKFGHDAVSLDARMQKPFEDGNYVLWLKNFIAGKLSVFPEFAERHFGPNMTRSNNFFTWSRKYIPTRIFYECKSLDESLNQEYDVFFVGSDQVWNYHFPNAKFDDYFLKFAEDKKKASICGSFGVEAVPEELRQTYIDGLSGFAHISVRENAGAKIVKDLIGRDVPVLVDPTMLLSTEEWLRVSKHPRVDVSQHYVLKYYLGDSTKDEIDQWADDKNYKVYELMNDRIPELYSAGPGEFISLIANASLVVSDSFHCIVFAILFHKPFVVYERQGKENYMTSRLDTLLGKFGFQDRWKHAVSPDQYLLCDFSNTEITLKTERKQALSYIKNVLDSVK